MKKFRLLILLLLLIFMITSCSGIDNDKNDLEIADETFHNLISAVYAKNEIGIIELFSHTVREEADLERDASELVDFICGDFVSKSSASDSGIGTDSHVSEGKKRKEIQSSFCINTTENTYYVAIKECTVDESDEANIGILSVYIIEAENWVEDYVYRGDGEWVPGIHIVTSQMPISN